jgi:hypothetical protein
MGVGIVEAPAFIGRAEQLARERRGPRETQRVIAPGGRQRGLELATGDFCPDVEGRQRLGARAAGRLTH